jgi:hypothetical protein
MCKTWTGSQSTTDRSSSTAFAVVLVPSQENAPPTITRGQTENLLEHEGILYCDKRYIQVITW